MLETIHISFQDDKKYRLRRNNVLQHRDSEYTISQSSIRFMKLYMYYCQILHQ
jgi:hypothetical protein